MSKIQVNEIVNHFDNGAPDCPKGLTVTGVSTFSGNVSIGGTLSYEDVTNIDSVGIITAQSGIRVTGGDLSIEGSASQILSIFCNDTGVQATPRTFINLYGDNTANEKKLQAQIASAPGNVASSAGELHFSTNNSSSVITRRMTINQDGEVGIGTETPQTKLDVRGGTIRCDSDSNNYQVFANNGFTRGVVQVAPDGVGLDIKSTFNNSGYISASTISGGALIEAMRIDSSGRLLVNTTVAPNLNNASGASARYPLATFYNTTTDPVRRYTAAFIGGSDNANGALIRLGKNRGTSATAANIVNDGDELGRIDFVGADGTQYVEGAKITCEVDGTTGVNDMPGTIIFSTTGPGGSSATGRMKVQSDGNVSVTNKLRANYTQISSAFLSGTTVWDTGYSINQSNGGGCSLLLASRNTSNGTTTQAAVYRIHWYYDGNNPPATALLSGTDFITFSTTGANTLGICGNTSNWVTSLIHSSNMNF